LFGSFPRSFWLLIAGMFVNRLGAFVLPFLAIYLREHEGFGTAEVARILMGWGIGCVIAGVIGGQLTDRWGRKATMLLSLCGGAVVLLALVHTHDALLFAALALLLGSVAELYRPAVAATISDLTAPHQRAQAFAYLTWAYNLGFAISPVIAGWCAKHVGFAWLFYGDAATMLLAAAVLGLFLPETRPQLLSGDSRPAFRSLDALRDRRFQPLLLAAFAIGLVMIQFATSLGPLLRGDGIDLETFGRISAVNGLLIVLVQPWLVPRLEQWGRYRVIPLAALLFCGGFALHATADTAWMHVAVLASWTLGEVAIFPLCNAVVSELAPESARGRYQGLYWMAWACSNVVGPPVGLLLLAETGELGWALFLAALGFVAAFALLVMARRIRAEARTPPLA
ncbi:MAG: MFS transporter, partial [Planctomycetes bacterium]|nr:MFS transporter [Planctomycetota bacterium]